MESNRVFIASQIGETMQGALVRVAGSRHQEDRVVARGGREIAASRKVDAHTVEDDRAHCGTDSGSVLGTV